MPSRPAQVSQGCGYGWAVANASLRLCVHRKQVGQSVCVRFEMLMAFCSSSHCSIWDSASVHSRRSCHDGSIQSEPLARINIFPGTCDARSIRSCCSRRQVAESVSVTFEMLLAFCTSSYRVALQDTRSIRSCRIRIGCSRSPRLRA